MSTETENKTLLCELTLNFVLKDVDIRIDILKNREESTLNTARLHEMLLIKSYLQDIILVNKW